MVQPYTAQICKGTSKSPCCYKRPLVPLDAARYQPFKPSLAVNEARQEPQAPQETERSSPAQGCGRTSAGSGADTLDLKGRQCSQQRCAASSTCGRILPSEGYIPQAEKVKPTKSRLSAASQLHGPSERHLPPAAPAPTCARSRRSADASAALGSASAVINVRVKRQLKPPQPLPDTAPSCPSCYLQLC